MKKYTTIILIFFSVSLAAQELPVPDTVYFEAVTDSTFRVVREYTFKSGGTRTDKTEVLDSIATIRLLGNIIHDNELIQVRGVRDLKNQNALTAIYPDVNKAIDSIAGAGYLNIAFQLFKNRYVGYWKATLNQSTSFFQLQNDGQAIEVDNQGTPIQNGFSGTWAAISNQSFWLDGFFPASIYPNKDRIVSISNNSSFYYSLNSNIVFEKIN